MSSAHTAATAATFGFTCNRQKYEWKSYEAFQEDFVAYGRGIKDEELSLFLSREYDINLSTMGNVQRSKLLYLDVKDVLYNLYDASSSIKKVMNDLMVLCEYGLYSLLHPSFQRIISAIMKFF